MVHLPEDYFFRDCDFLRFQSHLDESKFHHKHECNISHFLFCYFTNINLCQTNHSFTIKVRNTLHSLNLKVVCPWQVMELLLNFI